MYCFRYLGLLLSWILPWSLAMAQGGASAEFSTDYDNQAMQAQQLPAVNTAGALWERRPQVGAYFTQWGIYDKNYFPKNIDTSGAAAKLDVIYYAFNNVIDNLCSVGLSAPGVSDAWADYQKSYEASNSVDALADGENQPLKGNWNQLRKLKAKYPHLKVIISLGGWTWSDGFYSAARPENRQAFVASCVDAYIKGNLPLDAASHTGGPGAAAGVFDGIDLDWEYPGICGNTATCGASANDRANFTALIAEFRKQLDAVKPGLFLSAAFPAGEDKISNYDVAESSRYLDAINLMAYDFFGAWDATGPTAFNSPLFAWEGMPTEPPKNHYFADYAVQLYEAAGAPAYKIHLGIGFYGHGWTGVNNANHGLNQPATGPAKGTSENGTDDYAVLMKLGYSTYISTQACTAWIFNGSTFWSFDVPQTVKIKMNYVKSRGLGGSYAWSLDGDDAHATMISTMKNGLLNYGPITCSQE